VPVKVPDDSIAMGFIYDDKTKQLEGLPLAGKDVDSITIATRHFCTFFISMIKKIFLKNDIDSGFRPGIDDWQFVNYGSYIAPGGHCEGQSLSAMWYYCTQPDGKDLCLYNRYDNNGNQPATPDLWQDDSLGYRFCSTIHCDYQDTGMWGTSLKWDALAGIGWKKENNQWKRIDVQGISDASTWRLFAYSIQASGQPQYVSINSNAGGWHAMICYAVSDNNTLRIADPNYHGRDDRKIEFVDNKFKPYNSGANKADIDAGNGTAYEKIIYRGAWTIMPYDQIAQRWTEFKNKTIGNDRFPAYTIQYKDRKGLWQELKDGYISQEKLIKIQASFESEGGGSGVYRDGAKLPNGPKELKPGNNLLGIYIAKDVADHNYEYVDFKYINVIYGSLSIDPATLDGELNKQYAFTAKADSPPAGARYDWYVDGSKVQSNTSTSYSASFKTEGSHKVSVKLVDGAGKEIQEAEAAVTIKAAASGKWVLDGAPVMNNQMHTDDRFNKLIKAEIKQGSATYNVNHIHSDGHVMGTTKADFTFTEAPGELVPGSNVKFTVSGEYSGTGTCYPVTCRVTSEEIADTAAHTYFGCYVAISDTDKKKAMTNLAFIPTKDEFNKGKLHFIYLLDGPAGSQTITYTYK